MSVTELVRSPALLKFAAILFIAVACFLIGKNWAGDYEQIFAANANSPFQLSSSSSPRVALAPSEFRTYDLASLNISSTDSSSHSNSNPVSASRSPPRLLPPPPPPPPPATFGIIGPDGTMQEDFSVGDEDLLRGNETDSEMDAFEAASNGSEALKEEKGTQNNGTQIRVKKFETCPSHLQEYIPCMDNFDAIKKLNSTARGERFERHCPSKGSKWCCVVPTPRNYKTPIVWPKSRDEVWYNNVPHTRLVEDKGGQNWIVLEKDKFKFPGGGTQFIHGANQYIDQMAQMVPELAWGVRTRVVLDVGCGVASFGAFLFSRNVITLSIAPKDVHENQIQFALERGVPAMVAAFATQRLLYPSQAFDMIHCSRCRIDWTRDGGILLLEANRMLRAGGYFAWAAQPVYKHEEKQQEVWKEMENLTSKICWNLVKKDGYVAIWQKPLNNSCYFNRNTAIEPPLCDARDDPDDVWYVPLKACITRLPEYGYGGNLTEWPARLHSPPERLELAQVDAFAAKKEIFNAETGYWNMVVESYQRGLGWKRLHLRNVMDMRAGFGGFAAALLDQHVDAWVMNVVPVSGPNTLSVIYDRGLIGVMHDWCEPFDTYPRTYDLLHAFSLFSVEQKRCDITDIMLEMDRILRPGGYAYIRDSRTILPKLEAIGKAMGWRTRIFDTEEGPYASRKVLSCQKPMPHK
eukprot:TRINITY_DN13552_c0_g1_i2.p1 TRINITY_DN13552_c0_g1~~TRINITY_DN13552_c0_g1_i2.p1  ORF type:complete len:690 (-),score=101.99 TRINITY_DN13552_c0_g1_i2:169-2238(-)